MLLEVGRKLCRQLYTTSRVYTTVKELNMATETSMETSSSSRGGVMLAKVVAALEDFAPRTLSESWDNTGLLVEPYSERNITKVLLTNDLTEDVALEACALGCEMIVSYHPPIFAPLKSVNQKSWKERIVSLLLERRIALYSPHTSWDCVRGGVNDWLASAFEVQDSAPITPRENPSEGAGRLLKLVQPLQLRSAVERVKRLTGLPHVRVAVARGQTLDGCVQAVALCAGSGASVLKGVSADLYLTGEMLHHDILDAAQKGTSVILTNHSDSERGFLAPFSSVLRDKLGNLVDVRVSQQDRDPLVTV